MLYLYDICIYSFLQASVGSGMSFCGMSMDWNEVLADYEGNVVREKSSEAVVWKQAIFIYYFYV